MTKSIILKYLTKINLCASKSLSSILSCYKNNSDRIVTTETRVIKTVSLLNDLNIILMNYSYELTQTATFTGGTLF